MIALKMSRRMVHGIKLSVGLCLLASLVACNQDMSDLQQYMDTVKARPAAPIEPIPEIKPYVRFIYPGHEVDPFDADMLKPEQTPGTEGGVSPDPNRVPEFLESFPLDSLRMVGTVYQGKDLWALIRIPDGAVHRVKVGNYMGKNHGKVTKVEETRVGLLELVDNGFGGYKEQENAIALSGNDSAKK